MCILLWLLFDLGLSVLCFWFVLWVVFVWQVVLLLFVLVLVGGRCCLWLWTCLVVALGRVLLFVVAELWFGWVC